MSTRVFHFDVPQGWTVSHTPGRTTAKDGSDMVQVATFALVRAYDRSLFGKVEVELAARMKTLAQQTGGTVDGHSTVTAGGIRSHSYDVRVDGRTDTYVFVLKGKREFQLLCSAGDAVCARFVSSFAVG